MSHMTEPAFRPLTVGEILDQAFVLYRRHLPVLVTIALICTALPLMGFAFIAVRATTPEASLSLLVPNLLLGICFVVLSQLAIGASTLVLTEGYLGRRLGTGEALRRAAGRIGSIVALSMSTSLVIFLGLLLLIVPGVILVAGLAVATPALMIEPNLGASAAMSRSWELTRGFRGRMLVLLLVPTVIMFVAVIGLAGILGAIFAGSSSLADLATRGPSLGFTVAEQAINLVVRTFLTPLFYCVITVTYFDLRVRTEGFDLEMLASTLPGIG